MILILSSGCIGPQSRPCYRCGTPDGRERGRQVVRIDLGAQGSADDSEHGCRNGRPRRAYHGYVDDRDRRNRTRSEGVPLRRDPSNRPRPWLFHVFSCDAPTAPLTAACDLDEVDEVALGRAEPGAAIEIDGDLRRLRLGFSDQWMSTRHARIERTVGGFYIADEDSKNGLLLNGERTAGALLVD